MNSLFPNEPTQCLPSGFAYHPGFLSPAEEEALLAEIAGIELANSRYHEYTALRRTASFRLPQGQLPAEAAERSEAPPAPECIAALALKLARFTGRSPRAFPHALLTEYPPGAPMGWHRDAPPWSVIYGVSLAADCRFFLRPQWESRRTPGSTLRLTAERRSLYVMAGASRSDWQHSIPPVKQLRYSITLRTM